MSFRNLKLAELFKAAKYFDLNVSETDSRSELFAALDEADHATWSNYKKFVEGEEKEQADPELSVFGQMVLLKMERTNPRFDIFGKTFTRSNPFVLVSEQEAQEIIDAAAPLGGGFRIATPSEAKSFFG